MRAGTSWHDWNGITRIVIDREPHVAAPLAATAAQRKEKTLAKKKKSAHGGKRNGAGPKQIYAEPLKVRSIRLTDTHVEAAKLFGAGDLSEGVRKTIEACAKWHGFTK